jgi:hypothetical protein
MSFRFFFRFTTSVFAFSTIFYDKASCVDPHPLLFASFYVCLKIGLFIMKAGVWVTRYGRRHLHGRWRWQI